MLVFNEYFGSYALRQLVADHINDNKDVYINYIEGDTKQIRWKKLGWMGWNSIIIYILKHDWCLNWTLVWCQKFLNRVFT